MDDSFQVFRNIWHGLEHVHTVVWIFGLLGISAASVARFRLHIIEGTFAITLLSGTVFLFGVYLTLRDYKRRRVKLTVLDIKPEPARNRPDIEYKSKLRVALRNDSREIIIVRRPHWGFKPGYVGSDFPPLSCLQLECGWGWEKNHWENEAEEIHVGPKQAFLASVALDPSTADDAVRQRLVAKRLGTLELTLLVAGHEVEHKIRL